MKVKICGIMSNEAALAACQAGADLLGYVFADSKRRISPQRAGEISATLPEDVKTVGVFVNEQAATIIETAKQAHLDYIQLHGDETPEFCKQMPLPVIKAVSVSRKSDLEKLKAYDCEYMLVDSPGGGTGVTFDWSLLDELDIPRQQLILAGGLHEGNVADAIEKVRPAAVDVSSGVETDGTKDIEKIMTFIKKAKFEERGEHGSLHIT